MDKKWSLKELYSSFDCKEFKGDMKLYENYIEEYKKWVDGITNNEEDTIKKLEQLIDIETKGEILYTKLGFFSELTLSVDTKNSIAMKNLEAIQNLTAGKAEHDSKLWRWIGNIKNLEEAVNSSSKLKEFSFHIKELANKTKFLLSDREEGIIAKMKSTGSIAWSKLKDLETSNLMVDIELDGKMQQLPLTVIRNMAYDESQDVRKKAYEAEIKSYSKIADTVAACLNGIKGEVITTSELKGYKSPMEKTLLDSRMEKKTLDVMIVGTGAAALYCSLNLRKDLNVVMLCKSSITESNSYLAQGGIATALNENDIDPFVEDTLAAGNNKNDLSAVKILCSESIEVIDSLIDLDVPFDRDISTGNIRYTREGAHRVNRIVHCEDSTGKNVVETLLQHVKNRNNIRIFDHTTVVDLLCKDNRCTGVSAFNQKGEQINFHAKAIVLACGGIGGLFKNSTNQKT